MSLPQSLADLLGVPGADLPPAESSLEDITDPKDFATAVLSSAEFRRYIVAGLRFGELSSAVVVRLMDYAWGKPPDRVEHSGPNGAAIQTVKIVRVIVDPENDDLDAATTNDVLH
jgi:hypothetical protein